VRTRNEQTQIGPVGGFPVEDPFAEPPQVAPPAYRPQVAPPPYRPEPVPQAAPAYEPVQPAQPARRAAEPARRAPERAPEREPVRERAPRRRRRWHIPGSGCLKTLLVLVVIGFLVWRFSPLHGWIDHAIHTVEGWWNQVVHWYHQITNTANKINHAVRRTGN
jgi:serine/threonine-protein kinase